MRALVDCGGDGDILHGGRLLSNPLDSSLFLSLAPRVDVYCPPLKRTRVSAPFIPQGWEKWGNHQSKQVCSIDSLTDECLFEILRRVGGKRERSISACVSKRWLMLLSSICSSEVSATNCKSDDSSKEQTKALPDLNETAEDEDDEDEEHVLSENDDNFPRRCLEGKEATDIRLAAMAVGTGSRGGVGELLIRGSNGSCQLTDVGLSAIARNSSSLRVLSIWNSPSITDESLSQIANYCPLLEKLDLCRCPLISDKGISAIAMKCPRLSSLMIESCQKIGNEGLRAIGQWCPNLKSVSIVDSVIVGDRGVAGLVSFASSSLQKIKLERLTITDVSLAVIGLYGKAVTELVFSNLPKVGDKGFWVMGSSHGLQKLKSFTIASCGVTDVGVVAVAKGCPLLKQLCLQRCIQLSDAGLKGLAAAASSLEILQLEECNCITLSGIVGILLNRNAKLRSLTLTRCMEIRDVNSCPAPLSTCVSLRSLSICQCPDFGNSGLALIGKLCRKLQHIKLCGLGGVTDAGLLPLFEGCDLGLVKVNLGGCLNVTDATVSALVKLHGGTLQTLNLDGCRKITDKSLFAMADSCVMLEDIDLSKSAATDDGIAALASAIGVNLRILSLSGCSNISLRSLLHLSIPCHSLLGLNLQLCTLINSHGIASFEKKMWQCDILI
uniref:EIN3-binding F-box protein 1 n=1 Tax=Anthurium amnicola TaxID=1678845 RepID=A0A1D1Z617_9ARAE